MQSPHWSEGTETADTTCALSGSISGAGKSMEIKLRMCGPPLYLVLGEAFDISRQAQKSRQRFACFSLQVFLAVCEIHSVWAVLMVIVNEVEVCPLFAALRMFCYAQHIRNMYATWRVARPRNL